MAKVKKKPINANQWLKNKAKLSEKHGEYGPILGLFLITLLILTSLLLPKNQFQKAKERLVKNPKDFEAHLVMAEEFLKNNQLEEAEKELLLAQQIQPLDFKLQEAWQKKWQADPEDIRQLISFWEKIVAKKTDYRDGFLQLAFLYYKINQNDQAQENLQKALIIDPNYEPIKEMERILKEN